MGIAVDDFTWYEVGKVESFIARSLPQIVNELAVDGEPLTVVTVNQTEVTGYEEMQVALIFENLFCLFMKMAISTSNLMVNMPPENAATVTRC